MLSVYDLKLINTCEDSQMICSWFLQHLKDCFHIDPALMLSHIIWLDFGNEDVLNGMCLKEVTLLHKISCFVKWFKLFVCPQSQWIKVITSMYPCLVLWDVVSLLVELTVFNGLCKNGGVIYNKAYNSQKKLFVTIFKGHTLFNNSVFEAFRFSQSQLDQWYVTN